MKLFRLIALAIMLTAWVDAQTAPSGTSPAGMTSTANGRPLVITEACLNQDKPPCLMVTTHLREPDGTNATKIVFVPGASSTSKHFQ